MASTDKFAVGYVDASDIGGWLGLLIAWLWLGALLFLLSVVAARHSYLLIAWSLGWLGLTGGAAYFLMIKDRKGVLLAKLYLAARLVATLVASVRLAPVGQAGAIRTVVMCAILVLWYLYLVRSQRVKAVYTPAP